MEPTRVGSDIGWIMDMHCLQQKPQRNFSHIKQGLNVVASIMP